MQKETLVEQLKQTGLPTTAEYVRELIRMRNEFDIAERNNWPTSLQALIFESARPSGN